MLKSVDYLTGLISMPQFFEETSKRIAADLFDGKKIALLYMDLNGMKFYNEKHGFSAGNTLLQMFSEVLMDNFCEENCCRLSSDNFAVYICDENLEERITGFLNDWNAHSPEVTVRIGVYDNNLTDIDISVAFDRAKIACDSLKNSVVSKYRYFDAKMYADIQRKHYIIENLDRALEENWVQAYYQPIVRTSNGLVCSEEALARWNDPVYGFIQPDVFIPILEESKLIHKLDLYILGQILRKIKHFGDIGLNRVQHSINLSRVDFEVCDIVSEVSKLVDSENVPRSLIAIEITESVIGMDFDFMDKKIKEFKELGFSVWMDDFGSGYSSLDILERVPFDLIKFDMKFMQQFDDGERGKIILTELMKMAIGISVETICEGVEKKEQAEFLKEIGCSKLQGYYFEKPISLEQVKEKYRKGIQIGFENPEESSYYDTIGNINLYDMSIISSADQQNSHRYFDTSPMAIVEYQNGGVKFIRSNPSFRNFISQSVSSWIDDNGDIRLNTSDNSGSQIFVNTVKECCERRSNAILDQKMSENTIVHTLVKWVATNEVKQCDAVAIAVLAITDNNLETTYANIARALAADYFNLFYVDVDTENFIEYSSSGNSETIALERHGTNFFEASKRDASKYVHEQDREHFISIFTKENVLKTIQQQGSFLTTYRYIRNGVEEPVYVTMKATRMTSDSQHIIIGVGNIDIQMHQKTELTRLKQEKTFYARITALAGNYICTYTVDPDTECYVEYSSNDEYAKLGLAKSGMNFFAESIKEGRRVIHCDDIKRYEENFKKENILAEIKNNGIFKINYRLVSENKVIPVTLKAAIVEEDDGKKLIVGVRAD